MTPSSQPLPPRRRRGGQPKPATERKRNNMTFRVRDQLRADLEQAAAAANRSVSEQIVFLLGQAFQWQKVLGDLEAFKVRMAEMQRQTEAAERYRAGWGKRYDPNVPGGFEWLAPGTHNLPQGGFQTAPPPPTLPPILAEAVRSEVQSAVKALLEEAGLLGRKKKSA
jgi:uncharacterized protein (DUF1778 family)